MISKYEWRSMKINAPLFFSKGGQLLCRGSASLPPVSSKSRSGGNNAHNENRHNRVTDTHSEHMENLISAKYLFYQRDVGQSEVYQGPKPLRNRIAHWRQPYICKQNRKTYASRTHLAFHAGGNKTDHQAVYRAGKNKPHGPDSGKLPDLKREQGTGIGGNGLDGGIPAVETPMGQKTEQKRSGTPEEVAQVKESYTGQYLKPVLERDTELTKQMINNKKEQGES